MIKVELKKANEVYGVVTENGKMKDKKILSNGLMIVEYEFDGWNYRFFIDRGIIRKIEESNHREYIEVYVNL